MLTREDLGLTREEGTQAVAASHGFGRSLLVACDVTGYGGGDDQLQAAMQDGLVKVLDEAAGQARLVRSEWDKDSSGDGELALLPANASEPRVVDDFVRELGTALARHNRHLAERARLRLRVAIHFGVAYPASNGYAGQGVVAVSRLLDSGPIREVMRESDTDFALIVSDGIYSDLVLNGHTSLRPQDFRKVAVRVKEFAENAWIWLPHGGVNSLSMTEPGRVESNREAPDVPAADERRAGAGGRESREVSVRNEFHNVVIAPGSVFGIDKSGR
jgi:hypothetical protein